MKSERQYSRIKLTDHSVSLDWDQKVGDLTAKTSLDADEAPSPEFLAEMQALRPEILKVLGLSKAFGEDVTVRTVHFKFQTDGELKGVSVVFTKPVADSNAPWAPSTPFIPAPSEDGSFGMSGRMRDCLEELIAHADRFVNGHRAQVELFVDSKPALAAEEEAA